MKPEDDRIPKDDAAAVLRTLEAQGKSTATTAVWVSRFGNIDVRIDVELGGRCMVYVNKEIPIAADNFRAAKRSAALDVHRLLKLGVKST